VAVLSGGGIAVIV